MTVSIRSIPEPVTPTQTTDVIDPLTVVQEQYRKYVQYSVFQKIQNQRPVISLEIRFDKQFYIIGDDHSEFELVIMDLLRPEVVVLMNFEDSFNFVYTKEYIVVRGTIPPQFNPVHMKVVLYVISAAVGDIPDATNQYMTEANSLNYSLPNVIDITWYGSHVSFVKLLPDGKPGIFAAMFLYHFARMLHKKDLFGRLSQNSALIIGKTEITIQTLDSNIGYTSEDYDAIDTFQGLFDYKEKAVDDNELTTN